MSEQRELPLSIPFRFYGGSEFEATDLPSAEFRRLSGRHTWKLEQEKLYGLIQKCLAAYRTEQFQSDPAWTWHRSLGETVEVSLPQAEEHRTALEIEYLKTQLIAERRSVLLARRREDQLMNQNEHLATSVKALTESQNVLLSTLIAKTEARV